MSCVVLERRHDGVVRADVEEVAAVLGYQAIDERDVGAVFNESTGEVRSDEAQPTGHKYPLAGEVAHRPVAENRKPL